MIHRYLYHGKGTGAHSRQETNRKRGDRKAEYRNSPAERRIVRSNTVTQKLLQEEEEYYEPYVPDPVETVTVPVSGDDETVNVSVRIQSKTATVTG